MGKMMKHSLALLVFVGSLLVAPVTIAADLVDVPAGPNCQYADGQQLLAIDDDARLSEEVVRLMDHAVAVSEDSRWINSSRPAFLWANEAKAACGIAYGYLKTRYRDDEFLGKCECFHARMVHYMN